MIIRIWLFNCISGCNRIQCMKLLAWVAMWHFGTWNMHLWLLQRMSKSLWNFIISLQTASLNKDTDVFSWQNKWLHEVKCDWYFTFTVLMLCCAVTAWRVGGSLIFWHGGWDAMIFGLLGINLHEQQLLYCSCYKRKCICVHRICQYIFWIAQIVPIHYIVPWGNVTIKCL